MRRELSDRYSDERITTWRPQPRPVATLERLLGDASKTTENRTSSSTAERAGHHVEASLDLTGVVEPTWQLRFAASIETGTTPTELTQWESNSPTAVVPAVAIDGTSIFVNYLASIFALDSKSGKLLCAHRVIP